ncbi:hypothetical protein [Dyella sp.]|uniref:hypothetical protein n=1 Tax=Dyella sp. TaxID=1869338 RepID=UPI002B4A88AF|nr:hypothetical protein [Dyella sp.]HKT28389.1 hypothetical protein [Dyella sp.]
MNRSFARVVFALCAGCTWLAVAMAKEGAAVYTGTLGTQPIVMEIDTDKDGHIDGRYFYTKYHRDLPLGGSMQNPNGMHMSEGQDDDASKLPQIDLTRAASGNWSGTWRSPKGKTLALALQPAKLPAPAVGSDGYLQKLYASDLYEYLRLSGLTLQKDRKETFMGHTLQWWVEPQSKIALFEILDGYPDAQRQKINDALRARQWSEVSAFHACMLGNSRLGGGDYEQTVTPQLLSPNAISISVFTSYYCGGAHPDFGDAPINLDAHTAQVLTLEDVLWVGKGKPFHYIEDTGNDGSASDGQANAVSFDEYSKYRSTYLAPWLAQQLTALYPTNIKDDDCDYGDPSVWDFPSWHLTPKGISFTPSFARAMRVCEANDDWSLLPYSIVNQHPGGRHMTLP